MPPDLPAEVGFEPNRFRVDIHPGEGVWRVVILDPEGREVLEKTWSRQEEAELFASTARQHVRWLSEARFREYYRIDA